MGKEPKTATDNQWVSTAKLGTEADTEKSNKNKKKNKK